MTENIKDPDDIPTEITKLSETAPNVAMTDTKRAAWALAHFWPAIETHIREQIADHLQEVNPDRDADFSAGVDWATDTLRYGRL